MPTGSLHTVFCAECTTYFDWKSAGVYYTHRTSGMPGKITRLLACSDEQRRVYPQRSIEMGPTFIHPNYVNNPHNHEQSGSYNKPAAVMHWSREAKIDEDYVLYIDADMLLRAPIDPVALGARRGLVVSEHVHYLDMGISHHLLENFVPDASKAKWAKAAGWYHVFHIEDLRTIAPRWLHYCEQVRSNPQLYWDMNHSKSGWNALARALPGNIPTGDAYVHFGEAPWISEMYGYVFAAAEAAIDTKLLTGLVQYTDYSSNAMPPEGPAIIHYGLHCHVGSYHFTKYDYSNFDIGDCPKLFFRPPTKPPRHQELCAETINTLNDALCDFYRARCPGAQKLACAPHEEDESHPQCENAGEGCAGIEAGDARCADGAVLRRCRKACTGCCGDNDTRCLSWAFGGECVKNPVFMRATCKRSCFRCPDQLADSEGEPAAATRSTGREEAVPTPEAEAEAEAVISAARTTTAEPTRAASTASPAVRPTTRPAASAEGSEGELAAADPLPRDLPHALPRDLPHDLPRDPTREREERAARSHRAWQPSETQLFLEVAVVVLIGLAALACAWLSKRCCGGVAGRRRKPRVGTIHIGPPSSSPVLAVSSPV